MKQVGQSKSAACITKGLRRGQGSPEKPSYLKSKQSRNGCIKQLDLQTKSVHLARLSVL